MVANTSQTSLVSRSLDHTASLVLAFLLAQASVMYTCYWVGHTEGVRESDGILTDFEYTLDGLHIVISFCLGVCVVGLWLRRSWCLFISSVGLVGVLVTYGYWHFWTVEYLRELRDYPQLYGRVQEARGFFHGATKWDLVVLVIVAALFLWHVLKLARLTVQKMKR